MIQTVATLSQFALDALQRSRPMELGSGKVMPEGADRYQLMTIVRNNDGERGQKAQTRETIDGVRVYYLKIKVRLLQDDVHFNDGG